MASEALAFDTHRFVKSMTAVGMPVKQAEALAESQVELLNSNLATKNELAKTESALKADIAKTEATLKVEIAKTETVLRAEIAKTEAHLIKWMVGLTMGSVGVMVALFSFFLR